MNTSSYDQTRSLWLSRAIAAEPLRCWRNAALAVARFPTLFAGGCYVEGWMVVLKESLIEIVEYAWCRTAEPCILDPTLVLREHTQRPVFYYSGLEIASAQLVARTHYQILPLVCHSEFGPDGMGHPGYKRAFELARQQAHALAEEKHFPPTAIWVSGRDRQRRGLTMVVEKPTTRQ